MEIIFVDYFYINLFKLIKTPEHVQLYWKHILKVYVAYLLHYFI